MALDRGDLGERSDAVPSRPRSHLFVDLLLQPVDGCRIENAVAQQAHLQLGQRIESGVPFALRFGAIERFVVRKGMRLLADHVPVNKGRPLAGSAVLDRLGERLIACDRVGAIDLSKKEIGEIGYQA